jgi:hypothetical protein
LKLRLVSQQLVLQVEELQLEPLQQEPLRQEPLRQVPLRQAPLRQAPLRQVPLEQRLLQLGLNLKHQLSLNARQLQQWCQSERQLPIRFPQLGKEFQYQLCR